MRAVGQAVTIDGKRCIRVGGNLVSVSELVGQNSSPMTAVIDGFEPTTVEALPGDRLLLGGPGSQAALFKIPGLDGKK